MTRTPVADRLDIEAASASSSAAVSPAQVLRGDELIELSIKPSLWYILMVSGRVVAGIGVLAGAVAVSSARGGWSAGALVVFVACVLIAVGRIAVASLQWASRLYVLTNRRVLSFHGVLNVAVEEAPLARVSELVLQVPPAQRWLWIGTLEIRGAADAPTVAWRHINRPHEIYRKVKRAVHEAQHRGD